MVFMGCFRMRKHVNRIIILSSVVENKSTLWLKSLHLNQTLTEASYQCFDQFFYFTYQEGLHYKRFTHRGIPNPLYSGQKPCATGMFLTPIETQKHEYPPLGTPNIFLANGTQTQKMQFDLAPKIKTAAAIILCLDEICSGFSVAG